jgi:hypothetical protein
MANNLLNTAYGVLSVDKIYFYYCGLGNCDCCQKRGINYISDGDFPLIMCKQCILDGYSLNGKKPIIGEKDESHRKAYTNSKGTKSS